MNHSPSQQTLRQDNYHIALRRNTRYRTLRFVAEIVSGLLIAIGLVMFVMGFSISAASLFTALCGILTACLGVFLRELVRLLADLADAAIERNSREISEKEDDRK